MKVTVCQLSDDPQTFSREWENLVAHVRAEASDLVLLPEMPFYTWFPRSQTFEQETWQAALEVHDAWLERLEELAPAAVLGTRPVVIQGKRLNEGFIWDPDGGYRGVHTKHYLPDEDGFWEASWYQRGSGDFTPALAVGAKIGFVICTELWFFECSRAYGKLGVQILANPRGTLQDTVDKWRVGGQAAAIVSGAFSLSSNRVSTGTTEPVFGGQGWIIAPDGEVLGLTSSSRPFVTAEIDLLLADRAKSTYPRYVPE